MLKKLRPKQQGFTIIEVMIVLVIAAVILLIVFLAVPALQRNSRNTQRKNDVASVLSAVNEWSNNNNGTYPTNALSLYVAMQNAKLGFYTYNTTSFGSVVTYANGAASNPNNTEKITVAVGADCSTTTTGNSVAKNRTVAVLYTVETGGGGTQPACQSE